MVTQRRMTVSCIAAMFVAGVPVIAQQFSWDGQFGQGRSAAISAEPQAPAVGQVVPQENPATPNAGETVRIEATPLDGDSVAHEEGRKAYRFSLRLNNHKDRLIVTYDNCLPTGDDIDRSCDTLEFVVPGLTIDRQHHAILNGNDRVADFGKHHLFGVRLKNGYHLVAEKTTKNVRHDSGGDYDYVPETTLRVFLVKTAGS